MRKLTQVEQQRLKVLTQNSVSLALIQPTETALRKSIMDATGPVRNYLKSNEVHDYSLQGQGKANKVLLNSFIIKNNRLLKKKTSLYRPKTKEGDPRIWVYGLKAHAKPDDIIGLIWLHSALYTFNLTQLDVKSLIDSTDSNPFKELVQEINNITNSVADELLFRLRKLAEKGPIKSLLDADTSVGRTLESALGIEINSSIQPDYKGVELKSFRANKGNRKNLFAQVPNWELSKFKSSGEILNNFGYRRGHDFKLYCTVSTKTRNSQGLMLRLENDEEQLIENSDKKDIGDFVVWTLEKLHNRLLSKHNETFWISAETIIEDGIKYFKYTSVEHTRKPIPSQFDILLEQGIITVDHLIKRTKTGGAKEKGPLFKIKPNSLDLLFPPSRKYSLIN
ncbi:MAG: MvaI/BcnI family restriction endonuclease [Flavobacteriaceae bacterium]|nr:MvaI/BcnI family restriction endonuclease [Flavobacteriaceae bacterium]